MNKRLVLILAPDLYERLAEAASREERDPTQQARVILRRVLEDPKCAESPQEVRA